MISTRPRSCFKDKINKKPDFRHRFHLAVLSIILVSSCSGAWSVSTFVDRRVGGWRSADTRDKDQLKAWIEAFMVSVNAERFCSQIKDVDFNQVFYCKKLSLVGILEDILSHLTSFQHNAARLSAGCRDAFVSITVYINESRLDCWDSAKFHRCPAIRWVITEIMKDYSVYSACCAGGSHLSALNGGTAVTLLMVLGPAAGGIITSSSPVPFPGLTRAPRAGLKGNGLWGGITEGFGWSSDTI